jgi:hypothetical protein
MPLSPRNVAIGLIALCCGLALGSPASAKPAQCAVESEKAVYNGPCTFTPRGGGSFTITAVDRRFLLPRVAAVTVMVDEYGFAKVRAMTASGVELPWGDARRSKKDRSCWLGEAFRVCAS